MSIKDKRAEIDCIDEELLRLLNARARLAVEIGTLKRAALLPICDPVRERDVLARLRRLNTGPLDDQSILKIFRSIIRESRRVESRVVEARGNGGGGAVASEVLR